MCIGKTRADDDGDQFDCKGANTDGVRYKSIGEMWEAEQKVDEWYEKSQAYWREQPANIDGMLGGLSDLDSKDVAASRGFLLAVLLPGAVDGVALDCGAGVGRVTRHLLLPMFRTVDMLEQNEAYVQVSHAFLEGAESAEHRVEHRLAVGMQRFTSSSADSGISLQGRYALIWIQWSIIYLDDDDLVKFLGECVACLAPGGLICIKDNLARNGFLVDKSDASIMRSDKYMKALFERAQLKVTHQVRQTDFPRGLFPVKTYCLIPNT